ncbi:malectin domain-containing carbohydrate-binding protein [Streptomyces sp. NPDC004609]|uniref:malectin domain-containing carbohydrate-binding protein n=1 Tax=Streptomyces sp. NPDC004609 TaxID=3364704 RepID=UPI0036B03BB4
MIGAISGRRGILATLTTGVLAFSLAVGAAPTQALPAAVGADGARASASSLHRPTTETGTLTRPDTPSTAAPSASVPPKAEAPNARKKQNRTGSAGEAASAVISGTITSSAGVEANALITVEGTAVSTTSAADGTYSLTLPPGTYNIAVGPAQRCASAASVPVEVTGDVTQNVTLPDKTDTFGTVCEVVAGAPFPQGTEKLRFRTPHSGLAGFPLPFPVPLYGHTYRGVSVSVDGVVTFGDSTTSGNNSTLPTGHVPNGSLYPFWDDLTIDSGAGVYWSATGTAPHRKLIVEWRDALIQGTGERVSFAAVLSEDGAASFHYRDVQGSPRKSGASATVGVENHTGTDALLYSFDEATLRDGMSINFRTTKTAVITGVVTDANDGLPIARASAAVTGGTGSDITVNDGAYLLQVPAPGTYDLAFSASEYTSESVQRTVAPGGVAVANAALKTGRVTADTTAVTVVVPAGQQRTRTVNLTNTGLASSFSIAEMDVQGWLTLTPASGVLASGAGQAVTLGIDTTGATAGSTLGTTLRVTSHSGRAPEFNVTVIVVVTAYQVAVDTGGNSALTDSVGDPWTADRPYTAGGHGYLGNASRVTTSKPISGVPAESAPALYRTARQGMYEYRFDGLPAGTYRIELGFAELAAKRPAKRVFDVMAEGAEFVPNLDLALEAGVRVAHNRYITVRVTDGQLNLRFVSHAGKTLVNSIRVSERSDLFVE